MRQYTITLKFDDFHSLRNLVQLFREGRFVAERVISAPNRQTAVRKALQWFSTRFNGSVGPASSILTVDDPCHEVTYDQDFSCSDLRNKFLPEEVLDRVLAEANGELVRDTRRTSHGHPLCAVRRTKRRVKFKARAIAPCVYQNPFGTIFYRITLQPQVSSSGVPVRKRKTRLVRLTARTLPEALAEIQARRLPELHHSPRVIKKRSLSVLQQIALAPETGLQSPPIRRNGSARLIHLLPRNGARPDAQRDRRSTASQDHRPAALLHFPRRPSVAVPQAS